MINFNCPNLEDMTYFVLQELKSIDYSKIDQKDICDTRNARKKELTTKFCRTYCNQESNCIYKFRIHEKVRNGKPPTS